MFTPMLCSLMGVCVFFLFLLFVYLQSTRSLQASEYIKHYDGPREIIQTAASRERFEKIRASSSAVELVW